VINLTEVRIYKNACKNRHVDKTVLADFAIIVNLYNNLT